MKAKKAFALSIVLWIVLAMVFGITALSLFTKDTLSLTKALDQKLHTRLEAESLLQKLIFYTATASYNYTSLLNTTIPGLPQSIHLDGTSYQDGNSTFRITDTSALLNVMFASSKDILSLLPSTVSHQHRYEIKDSLKDWKDKDDIPLLNGAEFSAYENRQGKPYRPRNALNIQDSNELRLINGFDKLSKASWNILRSKLYYGDGTTENLMLMNASRLSALFNIRDSQAQALVKIREKEPSEFIKNIQKLDNYDDEVYGFHLSLQLKIEIETTLGEARTKLETIISFSPHQSMAYTIYNMQIK